MYSSDGVMVLCSGGAGGEQQCAGRLRDRGGAAGQGAAGEALSAEEDQTGGHDHSLPTGGQFKLHSPLSNSFNGTLRGDKVFILIISEFQLCDSEPGPQQQEGEVVAAATPAKDPHISQAQDSKPGANGSKSVYSAPLSQIGSSTNLQNGEL